MKIEIIDLKKRFLDEKKDLLICINKVLKKGNLVLTSEVENFEKKICKYTGSKYCLGLNSGTDALMMSLCSKGITKVDEVITISTEEAKERSLRLAKENGLFVGISAGANVLASERWIEQNKPDGVVITILCDRGERYFSVL